MATRLKALFLFLVFSQLMTWADSTWARDSQLHLRTGFLTGQYGGLFTGTFRLQGALDLDYEMFIANDTSFLFRFIQGFDSPDSRPYYTYAGTGMRHYFWGKGAFTEQSESGLMIASHPTIRAYVGGDVGIAQVIVKSFGPTVQAVANMVDMGGNLGAIYQVTRQIGVELQAGFSIGYGISSTHATGHTERLFLGMSYFF